MQSAPNRFNEKIRSPRELHYEKISPTADLEDTRPLGYLLDRSCDAVHAVCIRHPSLAVLSVFSVPQFEASFSKGEVSIVLSHFKCSSRHWEAGTDARGSRAALRPKKEANKGNTWRA